MRSLILTTILAVSLRFVALGQSLEFTLNVRNPSEQIYQVQITCSGFSESQLSLQMPAWTPGYYQLLNYAQYVTNFKATDDTGKELIWKKSDDNTWQVQKGKATKINITYDTKATIAFVANSLLDAEHGYVVPAGIFMHTPRYLHLPVTLTINNHPEWSTIATGLERVKDKTNVFTAANIDVLYDSPILLGNLEELPSFTINNIPHYFFGYKLGEFDKVQFMNDLKTIVQANISVIGDIPYKHYTFLAIGPVPGGIEHLNSTAFGFSSQNFNKPEALTRMYNFLSHEYFHHYNVKRIRPVELGPFDYSKGSKTTMLWLAEGFTNYYDELSVRRAGLITRRAYLNSIQARIQSFENKSGRLFQTASQASYETWTDGPFGRTGDDAYKTISVYEKGGLLGVILDLNIRHATQNKKSLDDVMRSLYHKYYIKAGRGFTEKEFRQVAEQVAGTSLFEFFDYVNTVKELDYDKYLGYAGIEVTSRSVESPTPWIGIHARDKEDSLTITKVDWDSPAWKAGLRGNTIITLIGGTTANQSVLAEAIAKLKSGDSLQLTIITSQGEQNITLQAVTKNEKVFQLKEVSSPTPLQTQILNDWLK